MIQYLVTARLCSGILDGRSALNLAAARLRHIVRTKWLTKRYMNTQLLKPKEMIASPTRSGQVRAYPTYAPSTLTLTSAALYPHPKTPNRHEMIATRLKWSSN